MGIPVMRVAGKFGESKPKIEVSWLALDRDYINLRILGDVISNGDEK